MELRCGGVNDHRRCFGPVLSEMRRTQTEMVFKLGGGDIFEQRGGWLLRCVAKHGCCGRLLLVSSFREKKEIRFLKAFQPRTGYWQRTTKNFHNTPRHSRERNLLNVEQNTFVGAGFCGGICCKKLCCISFLPRLKMNETERAAGTITRLVLCVRFCTKDSSFVLETQLAIRQKGMKFRN